MVCDERFLAFQQSNDFDNIVTPPMSSAETLAVVSLNNCLHTFGLYHKLHSPQSGGSAVVVQYQRLVSDRVRFLICTLKTYALPLLLCSKTTIILGLRVLINE